MADAGRRRFGVQREGDATDAVHAAGWTRYVSWWNENRPAVRLRVTELVPGAVRGVQVPQRPGSRQAVGARLRHRQPRRNQAVRVSERVFGRSRKTRSGALVPRSRGDAVWMFGDCNDTWEHCVMPGESDVRAATRTRATRRAPRWCSSGRWRREARRRARTRRRAAGRKKRVVRKNRGEPPTRRRRFGFGARRARERRERAGNERRGRETIDAGVLFTTYET